MLLIDYREFMILFDKIHDFFLYGNIELCPCFLSILNEKLVRMLWDHGLNTKLGGPQKRLEHFRERRNLLPCPKSSPGSSSPYFLCWQWELSGSWQIYKLVRGEYRKFEPRRYYKQTSTLRPQTPTDLRCSSSCPAHFTVIPSTHPRVCTQKSWWWWPCDDRRYP
jgi:hypothetical protein